MVHTIMTAGHQTREEKEKRHQGSNGGRAREGSKRERTRGQTTFYRGSEALVTDVTEGSGSGSNHLHDTVAQQVAPLPANEGV